MKRAILAFIVGLVTWVAVVTLIDHGLRAVIYGYAVAEPKYDFTLGMQLARLAMAAVTSLVAGAVVGLIAPASRRVGWILGGLLVIAFIPAHAMVWSHFPVWYHLTFLLTLAPLVALGARLTGGRAAATDPMGLPAA
jgi:hypothetical protein